MQFLSRFADKFSIPLINAYVNKEVWYSKYNEKDSNNNSIPRDV